MKLPDLLQGLDRSIPYYPRLAEWLQSRNAAVLLSYLYYLGQRSHAGQGWVHKKQLEIRNETGLTFYQQTLAREFLARLGVLEFKDDRINHRMLYRVNPERLLELWSAGSLPRNLITGDQETESRVTKKLNHPLPRKSVTSILEHTILHKENPPSGDTVHLNTTGEPAPAEPSGASSGGSDEKPKRVRKPKAEKPKASERGYKFADWFKTLLPADIRLAATWRDQWAHCFDELLRLDNREDKAIAAVCQWARKDDFWQKNFLSPLKLRSRNGDGIQYFDVFTEAMKAPAKGAAASMAQKKSGEYTVKPEDGPTVFDPMTDDIVIDGQKL